MKRIVLFYKEMILFAILAFACAGLLAYYRGTNQEMGNFVYENLPKLYLFCAVAPLFIFDVTAFLLIPCGLLAGLAIYIIVARWRYRKK